MDQSEAEVVTQRTGRGRTRFTTENINIESTTRSAIPRRTTFRSRHELAKIETVKTEDVKHKAINTKTEPKPIPPRHERLRTENRRHDVVATEDAAKTRKTTARLIERRPLSKTRKSYEVEEIIDDIPNVHFGNIHKRPRVITESKFEVPNAPKSKLFEPVSTTTSESPEALLKTFGTIANSENYDALLPESPDIEVNPSSTSKLPPAPNPEEETSEVTKEKDASNPQATSSTTTTTTAPQPVTEERQMLRARESSPIVEQDIRRSNFRSRARTPEEASSQTRVRSRGRQATRDDDSTTARTSTRTRTIKRVHHHEVQARNPPSVFTSEAEDIPATREGRRVITQESDLARASSRKHITRTTPSRSEATPRSTTRRDAINEIEKHRITTPRSASRRIDQNEAEFFTKTTTKRETTPRSSETHTKTQRQSTRTTSPVKEVTTPKNAASRGRGGSRFQFAESQNDNLVVEQAITKTRNRDGNNARSKSRNEQVTTQKQRSDLKVEKVQKTQETSKRQGRNRGKIDDSQVRKTQNRNTQTVNKIRSRNDPIPNENVKIKSRNADRSRSRTDQQAIGNNRKVKKVPKSQRISERDDVLSSAATLTSSILPRFDESKIEVLPLFETNEAANVITRRLEPSTPKPTKDSIQITRRFDDTLLHQSVTPPTTEKVFTVTATSQKLSTEPLKTKATSPSELPSTWRGSTKHALSTEASIKNAKTTNRQKRRKTTPLPDDAPYAKSSVKRRQTSTETIPTPPYTTRHTTIETQTTPSIVIRSTPNIRETVKVTASEVVSTKKIVRLPQKNPNKSSDEPKGKRDNQNEQIVTVTQIITRGNKKDIPDVKKTKGLSSSEEDIDEEDNYPEQFKALIQEKKSKSVNKVMKLIKILLNLTNERFDS